jgi:site-specific DNA-methyltransferase (adenine-specific)
MTIHHGNCIEVMAAMLDRSIDLILTDPPYITRYRHKNNAGQTVLNDDNDVWLKQPSRK